MCPRYEGKPTGDCEQVEVRSGFGPDPDLPVRRHLRAAPPDGQAVSHPGRRQTSERVRQRVRWPAGAGLRAAAPVRPVLGMAGRGGPGGEQTGNLRNGQWDHPRVGGSPLAQPDRRRPAVSGMVCSFHRGLMKVLPDEGLSRPPPAHGRHSDPQFPRHLRVTGNPQHTPARSSPGSPPATTPPPPQPAGHAQHQSVRSRCRVDQRGGEAVGEGVDG
jgi:hypothetical protein